MLQRATKQPMVFAGLFVVLVAGCAGPSEREMRDSVARVERQYAHRPASPEASNVPAIPTLGNETTLEDCLAYAAMNHPGLEAAFNRWKAALERVPQVRSLPDPRFTYRYYIREVETRVGPQHQSFGVAQTLPWFGTLESQGGVAVEAAQAARQRYEAEKLRLFYHVKEAYYEYHYLGRATAIIRENRDLVTYLTEVVRTRYKAAVASHPDVIRAQVELGKLDDRWRTLLDLAGPLAARLNAAMNRPAEAPIPWATVVSAEPIAATDGEILAWAREANPELKALEHEVASRREAIELARKDYFPDVTVGLDYIDTDEAMMRGTRDSGKDPVVAMVSVNLPIWFEKYAAGVREAQAHHWAALGMRRDRENTLGADVKMVLYRFRDAERKADLYGNTLLPMANESLKVTEAAFRGGQATFTDLIDAERILLEFELAHERALADHAQRRAELEMLVGRTIPHVATVPVAEAGGELKAKSENQEGEP